MKEGRVAEFGTLLSELRPNSTYALIICFISDRPQNLLQNPESEFYKLCGVHGPKEFDKLKRMAGL
jgi:hypothetical protein